MKKILSLILAVSLIASLCVVSVSAADSVAHEVAIEVSKTEKLAANDTVIVTLKIDNTANIINTYYALSFDPDVFLADATLNQYNEPNCFDSDWTYDLTNTRGQLAAGWIGMPTYNVLSDAGQIKCEWGVANPATSPMDDYVIGKFILKVKDGAPNGNTTISVEGRTADTGTNGHTVDFANSISVTVGEAPVGPTVGAAADYTGNAVADGKVAGITIKETDKKYDNCYAVSATIENAVGQIGVLFVPQDVNDWGKAADAVYGANLGGGTVTINAALRGIPTSLAGRDIVMLSKAYALVDGNYTYGTELTTTVNFDVTAE